MDRASGRTTRSSTRAVKLAPPLAPVAMTHAAAMSTQRDQCAACRQTASIEWLNSDRHPAVCYHCAKCRSADSGSSRSRLEDRMGFLEARLSKLQEQVHPLIHDLAIKPSCATNAEITTNLQHYMMNSQSDNNPPKSQEHKAKSVYGSPTEATQNRHKHVRESLANKFVTKSQYELSVICTKIKEPSESLLQNRHNYDMEEWLKLCRRMQLKPVEPVSPTRLGRSPNSLHKDKPRLLKVTVRTETYLERILLSAFLLQNGSENSERIFADVPWWGRSRKPGIQASINGAEGRSLIILGVPETDETSDEKMRNKHDFLQWKFLSDTLKTDDVAVVDTFRIPKSPKYMATGPKPLKLTLLRSEMLGIVKTRCQRYQHFLSRELRISSSTCFKGPTDADKVNAKEPVEQCELTVPARTGQPPTLPELASL
ncbi:hypothetical protein P879_09172 [Paragonimus westermani]|uniref:Uncharacterized protein n=1 Tax=Paragonimus westermani TaxID=34504 RepID=A0A8T0DHD6_9TREM|nr:hypothetical protein P879_09172 [Paragonimus westermani]